MCEILFAANRAVLASDLEENSKIKACREGVLYFLREGGESALAIWNSNILDAVLSLYRFGHLNSKNMVPMLGNKYVSGSDFKDPADLRLY